MMLMTHLTFRQQMLQWFWDALNAVLTGVASGLGTVITGEMIGALDFTPRQLVAASISGAIFGLVNYIRTRRLPILFEDDLPTDKKIDEGIAGLGGK